MIPYTEIQAKIYEILSTDVDLTALIGADKVFDFIPQSESFPFVHIGTPEYTDASGIGVKAYSGLIQIDVWERGGTRGKASVYPVMEQIQTLLCDAHGQFDLTDFKMVSLYQSFSTVLVEDDSVTYHGVIRFSFELVKKCIRGT